MFLAFLVHDPLAGTLMLLALLWLSAKLGGELAVRLKLPAVTGELAVGLALTALHRAWPLFPEVAASPAAELLGGLGVVVLMFAVGLESTVPQMLKVGVASLRVALIGVGVPMAAGLAGAWLLLPKGSPFVLDLFIGACLCATSIGISAQVLREKGASDSMEGRIIVGAAVVDDVLGLLVLVAVSGMVASAAPSVGPGAGPGAAGDAMGSNLAWTLLLALGFLAAALTLGRLVTPRLFQLASRFRGEQVLLPLGLGFAFLLAWLGSLAGLASIVGAYAAGLILEPAHIEDLERRERHTLEELVHPLVTVLSPLFFVLMGAKVDPSALFKPATLGFAAVLALLGVAGKYIAGFGGGAGTRAAVVGWGMVPRGEVGLIFVAAGAQLQLNGVPLLSPEIQAGIIGALLLTTVAGPVGLGWVLRKG
ncbi:Na+/H+-exchanging protein [Geothrix oryzae]|uniref:Na+/H+-exchanging protein n=1 Tax=Geothrix oryzae TaxID=2927975 RepID=A0ABM8DMW7_9BACT|nr:cation:proton antiporter [Geothrix oryzae]BDU68233.1 Na+/H+-exchanging protein [Geothrix oryzae]